MSDSLRQSGEKAHFLAYHDSLTGLPNRILFYDRVAQALSGARRDGKVVAALYLDIVLVRQANNAQETITDDNLLKAATKRLTTAW